MAISTETEALISIYGQKVESSNKQIVQVNDVKSGINISGPGIENPVRIPGPDEVIGYFQVPIQKLDNRILELNTEISNLRATILSIGQQASSAGCGTTTSSVTVTAPSVSCKIYAFSGSNPWVQSTQTLSSSNLGVGVQNSIVNVTLGSYRANIGICYTTTGCGGAPGGSCASAASSITFYEAFIPPLATERDNLITKVNQLKNDRSVYELQRYGLNRSIEQLESQKTSAESSLSFLQDPANEQWLS